MQAFTEEMLVDDASVLTGPAYDMIRRLVEFGMLRANETITIIHDPDWCHKIFGLECTCRDAAVKVKGRLVNTFREIRA